MKFEEYQILKTQLLRGEREIWDIPFVTRTQNSTFYIMAFRSKRSLQQPAEYQRVLDLLKQDILAVSLLGGRVELLTSVYLAYNEVKMKSSKMSARALRPKSKKCKLSGHRKQTYFVFDVKATLPLVEDDETNLNKPTSHTNPYHFE